MTDNNLPLDQAMPVRKGEEINELKLRYYLSETLDISLGQLEIKQFPKGYSNLTYLLSTRDFTWVLRRPPKGADIKSGHDMAREYKILKALSPYYTKAPKPVLYCEDLSIIGVPFYVMEYISGIILRAKMPRNQQPDSNLMQRISQSFVSTLIELHEMDYVATGLEDLGRPTGYAERQVRGWTRRYLKSKTEENPGLEKVIEWLHTHIPKTHRTALIHNDFKYDNLMLNPFDHTEVLAVLDWEMSTLGDPLMDLGTTLGYWVNQNDPDWMHQLALSPTTIPGNPTRSQLAHQYATKTGLDLGHIVFYYVFGLFKITVIVQQIYFRYKKGLTTDPRFATLNLAVKGLGSMALESIHKNRLDDLF